MKLCLNTHNLAGQMSLDEIIAVCKKHGIAGIEFSIGYGHKHGVELDTKDEDIRAIRDKIAAAGLETASIASYCRFDSQDDAELAKNMENAKAGIRLAAQMGCSNFRFVANDLPNFMDRTDFVKRIAKVLRELGDYGKEYGVTALLNMHGSFQYRGDVAGVMELCGDDNCGLVYNCDLGDLVGGSCEVTLRRVGPYLRHVHMHCMLLDYPYEEMFYYLDEMGYDGWYSIVVDDPSAEPDKFIGYYARLANALYRLA